MKRHKPMHRGRGFQRQGFEPRPVKTIDYTPRPRAAAVAVVDTSDRLVVPVPKTEYLRDEDYRRWVASLDCMHCGRVGRSQAAHADDNGAAGKGLSIKASDEFIYPACADEPGRRGCHWLIGSSGLFTKALRHQLESRYVSLTRALWNERNKS